MSFTDTSGRTTQTVVKLTVGPNDGLGGGDIQATLTWNGVADLDLHAYEPDGNHIYYGNRGPSAGGGELDWDSNAACHFVDPEPAENIHWPDGQAEAGTYSIWVQTYDECGTTDLDWHLVLRVRGVVVVDETGSGTSDYFEIQSGAAGARATVRQIRGSSLGDMPREQKITR